MAHKRGVMIHPAGKVRSRHSIHQAEWYPHMARGLCCSYSRVGKQKYTRRNRIAEEGDSYPEKDVTHVYAGERKLEDGKRDQGKVIATRRETFDTPRSYRPNVGNSAVGSARRRSIAGSTAPTLTSCNGSILLLNTSNTRRKLTRMWVET